MKHFQKIYSFQKGLSLFLCLMLFSVSAFSQIKSKKRGIAYGHHSEADMAVISKGISWWYNWDYKPESTVSSVFQKYDMDFVPMAWNGSFNEAGLRSFYASHPDAKYLLGFNEPNFTTQANMKPSQAAALWPKLEKIAQDFGLKIVGPAVNYSDKPVTENGVTFTDPVAYLDAFFAACPNCQVDYIAVHNYMCYGTALISYINKFKKYNKPIWLTEFACWDQEPYSVDKQKNLMMSAIDFLENDPMVFRYSWFTGRWSTVVPYLNLFDAQSGKLSDLGQLYISYNPIHDPNIYTSVPARLEAENYSSMSGIQVEITKDISGIVNVGYIDAGDWLEYNIDVPVTGDYTVYFRISANANTNLELRENNVAIQTLQIPTSGGWQNWKTLQTNINLTSGKHKLRIFTNKGSFNLNWLEITDAGQPSRISEMGLTNERVYPNPVKDKLFIESEFQTGETLISVLDLPGRIIFTKTFGGGTSRFEIDFSNFKSGSYIVQTKNGGNINNHLIIK